MKWSIPNQLVYREYHFKVGGRNVLNTGISDWVKYNFYCPPDNSGVTVTPPGTHAFHAIQVDESGPDRFYARFPAYVVSEIYTGCYHTYYGIEDHPDHVGQASLLTYPNPNFVTNFYSSCYNK